MWDMYYDLSLDDTEVIYTSGKGIAVTCTFGLSWDNNDIDGATDSGHQGWEVKGPYTGKYTDARDIVINSPHFRGKNIVLCDEVNVDTIEITTTRDKSTRLFKFNDVVLDSIDKDGFVMTFEYSLSDTVALEEMKSRLLSAPSRVLSESSSTSVKLTQGELKSLNSGVGYKKTLEKYMANRFFWFPSVITADTMEDDTECDVPAMMDVTPIVDVLSVTPKEISLEIEFGVEQNEWFWDTLSHASIRTDEHSDSDQFDITPNIVAEDSDLKHILVGKNWDDVTDMTIIDLVVDGYTITDANGNSIVYSNPKVVLIDADPLVTVRIGVTYTSKFNESTDKGKDEDDGPSPEEEKKESGLGGEHTYSKSEQGEGRPMGRDGRLIVIEEDGETKLDTLYKDTKFKIVIERDDVIKLIKRARRMGIGDTVKVVAHNGKRVTMKYEDLYHGYHVGKTGTGVEYVRSNRDNTILNNVNVIAS